MLHLKAPFFPLKCSVSPKTLACKTVCTKAKNGEWDWREMLKIGTVCFAYVIFVRITHFSQSIPIDYILMQVVKGQSPDYAHAQALSVFSWKDNRTVILTRQDFLPDCTADGDLLFIFSSNILDFRGSLSSYLKSGLWFEDSSQFYHKQGCLETKKSHSAGFKNRFSNLKIVSEVNCSKSSNICLICSRSSLVRLKDINKNAISALWIIAKVSQKLYYDFMALVFLNM